MLENVLAPTIVSGTTQADIDRARPCSTASDWGRGTTHKPAELSGGEKQRVAIARALVREPALLLCDEPTGNLDRQTAESVSTLLLELHRRRTILVIVTHNPELGALCGRQARAGRRCAADSYE